MYPVSPVFDYLARQRNSSFLMRVDIDGVDYGTDKVIEFSVDSALMEGNEFTLGATIKSRLTLKMRTNAAIASNARVVPYLSMSTASLTWASANIAWEDADISWDGSGGTEWLPLGEFFVDSRATAEGVWTYTCYDKLVWADAPFISALSYPATMQAVWDEICDALGYTYDTTVVIPAYTLPVAPTGYTMRQVLGYIAGCCSACVHVGKDGTVRFRRFAASNTPVYSLGPSDYARMKQTNPVKTYTRVVVTYDTERQLTFTAGTGDADHTLTLTNPFATQTIVDALQAGLSGFSYQPYEMDARGYPQLEVGDTVTIAQQSSLSWQDADMSWDGADIPWDGVTTAQTVILHQRYSFKGGLKMSLDAPSKSDQRSEFPAVGPISSRINKLDQTTVKQARPYYGVTTSHEEGLVIERDDGAAHVVLNADELTFYKGAAKALWFDVPNDSYKFSGVIEASSFVGGTIQIGSGTSVFKADSNGIYLGNETFGSAPFRVSPTGVMTATGGNFSGSITASSISGGTIDGTVITGGTVRTAASGQRVELNSSDNLLRAVNSSGYSLRIDPDAGTSPGIVLSDGSKIGLIMHDGTVLFIGGQLGLGLQLGSTVDVDIYAAGRVSIHAPDGLWVNDNLIAP